jgi:hypothetical protein
MHDSDSILRGHTATTKRLGDTLEIVAKKEESTLGDARKIERSLKRKEESKTRNLPFAAVEQPRNLSGLVGSSILPPGIQYLQFAIDSTLDVRWSAFDVLSRHEE